MFTAFDPHSCSKPGRTISKGLSCIKFLFSWLNINLFEVLWILIHRKCAICFFISFHLCVVIYFCRLATASTVLFWNIRWNQVWWKNANVYCCCIRFNVTFFDLHPCSIRKANVFSVLSWGTPIFSFFFFSHLILHQATGNLAHLSKFHPSLCQTKKRFADVKTKKCCLIFQTRGKLFLG